MGTTYDYVLTTDTKDASLCRCDGYCDAHAKRISIETGHNKIDPLNTENLEALIKQAKRHEIVHAFLFESGLAAEYAGNETLVDWIAWQFPKMLETFKQVDAL